MKRYLSAGILGLVFIHIMMCVPIAAAETPLKFGWSPDYPNLADYNGDGRVDLAIYDPGSGELSVRLLNGDELAFDLVIALAGYADACEDYDGDGMADPASYDRSTGYWFAWLSTRQYQFTMFPSVPGRDTTLPKPADYDGDGKADPALYDASLGIWVVYPSASGYQPVSFNHLAGMGCQAVPMDYDGDGKADLAVYDQESGLWSVYLSGGSYALNALLYGGPGCVAAPADFDGDRKADPSVYCAALGIWGTLNSASNYAPNLVIQGGPGCMPMPANYYFTNRADYAVYDTDEGLWYVAYDQQALQGIMSKIALIIINQVLTRIDDFTLINTKKNNEGQQCLDQLRDVNRKLDTVLQTQSAIQAQISDLMRQLQYDVDEVELLMQGLSAQDAISKIKTYYDQSGIDGYRTFYQSDTNALPANDAVLYFANAVMDNGIKEGITVIHDAILPNVAEAGLLRRWANLSAFTLTPDNLADHYAGLRDYFMNLYAYQMKGVCMYIDASQTVDTSQWARATTYTYVTNTFMGMIGEEVDEFRNVTYNMIFTAIKSGYNPALTNNPLAITNIPGILETTEFFARQCQGQTQSLCATFVTIDRPEVVSNYSQATACNLNNGSTWPLRWVVTNHMAGRPYYGYLDPDLRHITVSNGYAILRLDFGRVPVGNYRIFNPAGTALGDATVTNYDDNMNPTADPAYTNWFGHLYASQYSLTRLQLPVENIEQWSRYTPSYYHYNGDYAYNVRATDRWPTNLTNFMLGMDLWYEYKSCTHKPNGHGGYNFTYFAYPFSLSNAVGSGVKIRVEYCADNTEILFTHNVNGYPHDQAYSFSDSGGRALLVQSTGATGGTNASAWLTKNGRWNEGWERCHRQYTWETNVYKGVVNADLQSTAGQISTVSVAIGGAVQPYQCCWFGGTIFNLDTVTTGLTVSYKLRYVLVSFY